MPTEKLRESGSLSAQDCAHRHTQPEWSWNLSHPSGLSWSAARAAQLFPWPSCLHCVQMAIRLHPPHRSQTLRPRVLLTAPLSQVTASVQLLKSSFEPVGNSLLLQSVPFCLQALSGPRAGLLSLFCAPSFSVLSWVGGLPGSAMGLLEMRSLIQ